MRSEVEMTIYELLERHNAINATMLSAATGLTIRSCLDYLKQFAATHPEYASYNRGLLVKKPSVETSALKNPVEISLRVEGEDAEQLRKICRRLGLKISDFLRILVHAFAEATRATGAASGQEALKPLAEEEEEGKGVAETENV